MKSLKLISLFLVFFLNSEMRAEIIKPTHLKSLTFFVETNVGGFSFEGKLNEDKIKIDESPKKQSSSYELIIQPGQLTTGMSLRDEHMEEKIFLGKPIVFKGKVSCPNQCFAEGSLLLAGKEKIVKIPLSKEGDQSFRLKHKIRLSDFNIERPKFMGVEVAENVEIDILFQ